MDTEMARAENTREGAQPILVKSSRGTGFWWPQAAPPAAGPHLDLEWPWGKAKMWTERSWTATF